MTKREIELIENSWGVVLFNEQKAGELFYKKLFEFEPSLRHMFQDDLKVQSQKFVAMITFVVHKLNTLDQIIADVTSLGESHKRYGVMPRHYEIAGLALMHALEEIAQPNWNDEVKAAWAKIYSILSKAMMENIPVTIL